MTHGIPVIVQCMDILKRGKILRRRNGEINISVCVCPDCGGKMFVPRSLARQRKDNHLKWMWCPYCKKKRNMLEHKGNRFYKTLSGEYIWR